MKYIIMFTLLIAASAQAATERIELQWYEDFPPDMTTDWGYFECTAGGQPTGPFTCDQGGIHIRGLEGYTCLLDGEGQIVATTWFSLNANWDAAYTGPVYGEWKVIPGNECSKDIALAAHDSYFAGTYSGKRKVQPSEPGIPLPMTWIGRWKRIGRINHG